MDIGGRCRTKKRRICYVRFLYDGDPFLLPLSSDWEMVPFGSIDILDDCSILLPLVFHDLGCIREKAERI